MPELEILHSESRSSLNDLGVKGLGEGGVVGPPGVIVNGVCDALRPFGFEIDRSYVDQAAIIETIAKARG
jgi:carbon-monoxide dehydrogenase large subunit